MISPNELGIGAIVEYPTSCPYGAATTFTLTGTVDGQAISEIITVPKSGRPGGEWGRMLSVDANGKVLPTTPLRIDLAKQSVVRFTDNVKFSVSGTVSYEGSDQSSPSQFTGEILLPVVVLHGYVTEINPLDFKPINVLPALLNVKIMGYPGGNTFAPSCNLAISSVTQNFYRGVFYEMAYRELSDNLKKQGYNSSKYWGTDVTLPNYVTLWDPSDRDIGYSSLSYSKPSVIDGDFNRVYSLVRDHSYANSFSIIGHSTGGLTARYWASQHSEKINKIITVGTPH